MKILITSVVDPQKTAHNRLHEFIKYLVQNHEVTVLSVNDWWKAGKTNAGLYTQGVKDMLSGINLKYFTQSRINPVYQELISVATLGKILEGIQYRRFNVHLNYNSLVSGYFVAKKMGAAGIKTVYDIADDLQAMIRSSPQIPTPLRPIAALAAKVALKKNISVAERVTTIGESLRDLLGNHFEKTIVISNGVDTELFHRRPSTQVRNKLGLNDAVVLGYVGVLREWVDLEPIFSAVKELEHEGCNLRVLIVGEEGELDKNKALAQKYGISDKSVFTGTVPYTEVPEYVSCMDICLLPFRKDAVSQNALPLKLFEYMACEKPVISTRLRGVVEAVGDRVIYASDAREFQAGLKALYANDELRSKLGQEGRRFVEQSFSWSKACFRLEEILLEVSSLRNKVSR